MIRKTLPVALASALAVSGCGGQPLESPPAGVDGLEVPTPSADPADFVEQIDNPLLPLKPGSRWEYAVTGEDGDQRITVTVTDETRVVQGVTTTVVHDLVTDEDGNLIEATYDWFAQDRAGNVWYFGEDTTAYDVDELGGEPGDSEGSWEAGVGGAEAGLVMLAKPRVGDGYRQEYSPGVAEDQARIVSLDEEVEVPEGTYRGVLLTEDTTALEPALVEQKYYAPGIGLVQEETVAGGDERVELVSFSPG